MSTNSNELSNKQALYREMVLGTLVYSVVLGFFNDYTSILSTKSYSTTFLVAAVMQVLTYLTILLKNRIVSGFKPSVSSFNKIATIVGVWLVLFLSKFVFLAVIDFIFGESVEISGFVGLIAIILTMTATKELIDFVFNKLED